MFYGILIRPVVLTILAVAGFALSAGCAAAPDRKQVDSTTPSWVIRGSAITTTDGKRVFEGVGTVAGVPSRDLARQAADNRARGALVELLERFEAALVRGFLASTEESASAAAKTAVRSEQIVAERVMLLSAKVLPHAVVANRWTNPSDGATFSLARLELDRFYSVVSGSKELSESEKKYFANNGNEIFDSFAQAASAAAQ